MSIPLEQLEAEALQLPARDRAKLAHRLIVSLDEGEDDDPAEVELAWEEEAQRRLAEIQRGEVQTIPAEEVFARARASLSSRATDKKPGETVTPG